MPDFFASIPFCLAKKMASGDNSVPWWGEGLAGLSACTRSGQFAGTNCRFRKALGNRTMRQRLLGCVSTLIGIVVAFVAIEVTAILWLTLEDGRYTPAAELFDRLQ